MIAWMKMLIEAGQTEISKIKNNNKKKESIKSHANDTIVNEACEKKRKLANYNEKVNQ